MDPKTLSVIMPAYNEAATIHEILDKVIQVELISDTGKEIIIIIYFLKQLMEPTKKLKKADMGQLQPEESKAILRDIYKVNTGKHNRAELSKPVKTLIISTN